MFCAIRTRKNKFPPVFEITKTARTFDVRAVFFITVLEKISDNILRNNNKKRRTLSPPFDNQHSEPMLLLCFEKQQIRSCIQ